MELDNLLLDHKLIQPGDAKYVTLVNIGGGKVIRGGNGLVDGPVNDSYIEKVMENVIAKGFGHADQSDSRCMFVFFR